MPGARHGQAFRAVAELEEVLGMSDRVMVMWEGSSNGTLDSRIIAPATGVWTFTEIPPTSPVFYRSRQNN